ncbi:acyltransferase domain-containing protein [Saccharibacillus sacchari]|uniref:Acyltransferase domain-containing protein n=1 Tax=Saccharibacillus sacchari TaxID=456493 RepID=A0ACC6PJH0_9BACL
MKEREIVFMFAGQGSQYYHMGALLYERYPVFRGWLNYFDELSVKIMGESVLSELFSGHKKIGDSFQNLRYTHPAIFMFQFAFAKLVNSYGIYPAKVLGSSLGEFVAAALSGVCDEETAFKLVVNQSFILESHCSEGRMLIVIAEDEMAKDGRIFGDTEVVALNKNHFIVAGSIDRINQLKDRLAYESVQSMVLPIDYAFHSQHIERAKEFYTSYLNGISFNVPDIRFFSSCKGRELSFITPSFFWDVIRDPIFFIPSVCSLESSASHIYIDLSPSGSLVAMVHSCLPKHSPSECYSLWNVAKRIDVFSEQLENLAVDLLKRRGGR